ncbi:uncharacterized protein LOC130989721 [Salvia miltiorrhiza]|uniref:uncharacterized protein LOC130989721 n=1 Tax=Salvia miltiorrhiza TaxID=226208 RepID=UPI0025AC272E|nr:uncharacterized protein LOC130989721 [Salvia miltiorrhiza]
MNHACGTKSIAQFCYEERDNETGEEPSRTTAWRLSRYSNAKKGWIDEASKEVYDNLMKLQTENIEDEEGPMSEDEAFVKVLGEEKSSRLRGCGDGLKPPSKRGERINLDLQNENEELKKKNEELASQFESLQAQINNHQVNIQSQVEELLRAQLPAIIQSLNQSQVPHSK